MHPLRRDRSGFTRVRWEEASSDIGRRLRQIADRDGGRAIATYWGNAADSIAITMANTFCHAFGSPNSYNVLSLEYTDRGVVAEELYGNENIILQPDVARAKLALLLGTNPLVTQGLTLLQRRPHVGAGLKKAQAAGGTLVVVDPRITATTKLADRHLPIRPGTDLFLLLALIRTIIDEGLFDREFVSAHTTGFDVWESMARDATPERMEEVTALPASTVRDVARAFATSGAAYPSTRVGVQTSHNSVLTEWAVATLAAITGNIDRPGGLYHNPGVIDVPALIEKFTKRRNRSPSRIGSYPAVFGGLPAAVLADEILTPGEGQVRALTIIAGNPVISFPNTKKIEAALRSLELLVSVDIFLNDTATFAHYVLPAATQYEQGAFHFLVNQFDPHPFAELRPKVVEPPGECRSEWDIFQRSVARRRRSLPEQSRFRQARSSARRGRNRLHARALVSLPLARQDALVHQAQEEPAGRERRSFRGRSILRAQHPHERSKNPPGARALRVCPQRCSRATAAPIGATSTSLDLRRAPARELQLVDPQRSGARGDAPWELGDAEPRRRRAARYSRGRHDSDPLRHGRARDRGPTVPRSALRGRRRPPALGPRVRVGHEHRAQVSRRERQPGAFGRGP
jgi:anaerobic selenocysteine-containing dehydrogenase